RRPHRRAEAHLDRQPVPTPRLRSGAAGRTGERDRRPRLSAHLSDHRRQATRGRRAVSDHGVPPARRAAARRGRGLPARVPENAAVTGHLHLGVALDGYGWHPEAWRQSTDAEPVTSGRYWSKLAATAERGLLDFVTIDDALTPQRR